MSLINIKRCSKCSQEKDVSFFNKSLKKKDGLQSWCRLCLNNYSIKYHPKYYKENSIKIKERAKKYYFLNKDLCSYSARKYYFKQRDIKLRLSDLSFRIKKNLRSRLCWALRNNQKAGSAVSDLGCSIPHLKLHLELFWDDGMSWDNYGNKEGQWSIDHIKPLSSFDLTDRPQFLEACNYLNLQPMWHIDNIKKQNKSFIGEL